MVSVEQGKRISIISFISRHFQRNSLFAGMKGPLLHDSHRWVWNGMMSRYFYWDIYDMFRLWAVPRFFIRFGPTLMKKSLNWLTISIGSFIFFSVPYDLFQSCIEPLFYVFSHVIWGLLIIWTNAIKSKGDGLNFWNKWSQPETKYSSGI